MDIESSLRDWDGETVIIQYDRATGAWIFVAIHSTRLGPAGGGTRMKPYPDVEAALQDALRLAAAMTYTFAVPGIPRGGGGRWGQQPARQPRGYRTAAGQGHLVCARLRDQRRRGYGHSGHGGLGLVAGASGEGSRPGCSEGSAASVRGSSSRRYHDGSRCSPHRRGAASTGYMTLPQP